MVDGTGDEAEPIVKIHYEGANVFVLREEIMFTKEEQKLINQFKTLSLTKRIIIIQELFEGLKPPKHEMEPKTLTPEGLFREFESRGKIVHDSPSINHNRTIMGAAGDAFTSLNEMSQ